MRLDLTKIQVAAVAAHLRDALADDERAYLDTLEGETDLYEWVGRLLDNIETDEGNQRNLTEQMADRQSRKVRAEVRVKVYRAAIQTLLECAKLDKLVLAEATVSIRDNAPRLIVTDETAVPDEFCRTVRKPDMALIKAEMESGEAPGVSLGNGGTSLTIRRK